MVGIHLHASYSPNPLKEWPTFRALIETVLDLGALPFVTFTRFPAPYDQPQRIKWFANRCGDVVWNCIEEWGPETVREWFWCIWEDANSEWLYPGLEFDSYLPIYEETAAEIHRWLAPYLGGRPARIGGPSVDGFQPFWWDWIWRLIADLDSSLLGFVSWRRFGDWRAVGEWESPESVERYASLLQSRTLEYETRSRAIGTAIGERNILNICSGLNAHADHRAEISGPYNQSAVGAAYYAAALLNLLRGGADGEFLWMGFDSRDRYGALSSSGEPTYLYQAKLLVSQHVPYGSQLTFLEHGEGSQLMVVRVEGEDGVRAIIAVHLEDKIAEYRFAGVEKWLSESSHISRCDRGTGNQIAESKYEGAWSFQGSGVLVMTGEIERPPIESS
jgi:hypothetical protein